MNRRKFLSTASVLSGLSVAGCLSNETVDELPKVYEGSPDAEVTLVSFEDYSCPHCRDFALTQYPNEVQPYIEENDVLYIRKDFPVVNNISWRSGQFARAVQYYYDEYREGDFSGVPNAYWKVHDMLYENQKAVMNSPSDEYSEILESLSNGDSESVLSDTSNGTFRPVVASDKNDGEEIGVSSTPTILLNGNKISRESGNIEKQIEKRL